MMQGQEIERNKYRLKLNEEERQMLREVVDSERAANWKQDRARALLKADEGEHGPGWSDAKIAEAMDVSTRSLENWRKQAIDRGPASLMQRKPRDNSDQRKLDGVGEAKLTQLACSTPPEGCVRWTLRMLADRLVVLEVVDSISHTSVERCLKKVT